MRTELPLVIGICLLRVGEWIVAFFFAAVAYIGLRIRDA